jgi:hypothetical protein
MYEEMNSQETATDARITDQLPFPEETSEGKKRDKRR